MKLVNASMQELLQRIEHRKLICFGSGIILDRCCLGYDSLGFIERVDCIADNDVNKQGNYYEYKSVQRPICSLEQCVQLSGDKVFLITSDAYYDIYEQLTSIEQLADVECYVFDSVSTTAEPWTLPHRMASAEQRIPRKIHYVWFGGNDIPLPNQLWMESWKKFCPDYEIIRWDESNYDVHKNPYMSAAYKEKKWGFVSDYARLDVINEHGGVYLDTDVELLRNLDDLLYDPAFAGFQSLTEINFGLGYGATAKHPLIGELIAVYEELSFYNEDGSLNEIPCPVYQTELLFKYGLQRNNSLQYIADLRVYPTEVLCPVGVWGAERKLTSNTFSVHHFDASWFDPQRQLNKEDKVNRTKRFWGQHRDIL